MSPPRLPLSSNTTAESAYFRSSLGDTERILPHRVCFARRCLWDSPRPARVATVHSLNCRAVLLARTRMDRNLGIRSQSGTVYEQ